MPIAAQDGYIQVNHLRNLFQTTSPTAAEVHWAEESIYFDGIQEVKGSIAGIITLL